VCVTPITFETLIDFHEIQHGSHATEDDLESIFLIPIALTIPKWLKFKLLRWMQNWYQSTWGHGMLYTDTSSKDEQFLLRQFL
jgi:hypothetical protein